MCLNSHFVYLCFHLVLLSSFYLWDKDTMEGTDVREWNQEDTAPPKHEEGPVLLCYLLLDLVHQHGRDSMIILE